MAVQHDPCGTTEQGRTTEPGSGATGQGPIAIRELATEGRVVAERVLAEMGVNE
jgi:hypothetical protein